MGAVENLRVASGPAPYADRWARRAALIAAATEQLKREFLAAFSAGPQAVVRTPGAMPPVSRSIAWLAEDSFAGRDGDQLLSELLLLVRDAAAGQDVQLRAIAWRDAQAKSFAEYYASDDVDAMEADE